jgi:PAS domain S-box-containing protein
VIHCEWYTSTLRDPSGTSSFLSLVLDVTDRKRAEEALRTSETSLRGILDNLQDAYFRADLSGRFSVVSPSAAPMYGYDSAEEMIGLPAETLYANPLDRIAVLDATRRSGRVVDHVALSRRKDGTTFWVSMNVQLWRDATGQIAGSEGVVRDISERKKAEEALRESEALLRAVTDNSPDAIYVKDPQSRWLMANPAVLRIVGKSAEQALGRTDLELYADPLIGRAILENDRRVLQSGESAAFEELADTPDGRRMFLSIKAPRRDPEGHITGIIGISHDVTEHRRRAQALRRAKEDWERTFDSIPDLIAILDERHRITRVNRAMARRMGHQPEECVGLPCYMAIHGLDAPPEYCPHVQTLGDGKEHTAEIHEDRLGGDFILTTTPLPGADGRLVGSVHVARNITERRRVERLYTVLSRVGEAIVRIHDEQALYEEVCRIIAEEGQFPLVWIGLVRGDEVAPVASSGPASDYLGEIKVNVHGALGRGPTGTCVREDRPVVNDDFETNVTTVPWRDPARRHAFRASAAFPLRRGAQAVGALTLYTARPGGFDAEHVRLLEALSADLSYALDAMQQERLRDAAETALRESERTLRDEDRRKDEFIATLSHELRNPLAPIRYALPVIRGESLGGPAARAVAVIDRQLDQLTRLLDDLLDMARITSGRIELRRERIALASVVNRAVEAALPVIRAAGHRLNVTETDASIWIDADATRMAQVVVNLLDNAAKYTPGGGQIRLEASREDSQAVIRVRDTGIGIPPDMLGELFIMFRRLRQPGSAEGGLGIGLALSRRLVEMHGGSIEANSPGAGQGTEFVVRLPVAEPERHARVSNTAGQPATATARLKVLVVDDNADLVEMLALAVEGLGHEVRRAYDGSTAIAAALSYRPQVVLLDLGLPGVSGLDVAREFRQHPETAKARLVALTGWGQAEDLRQTNEAGFDYHLTKPGDLQTLEQLLAEFGRELAG